jgi:4-hydroxyphenylacetate 3-monooxygenase
MAAVGDYFAQNRPEFRTNIQRYYEYVREHDLVLTHTLVNLQRHRLPLATPIADPTDIALSVVQETDAGIVVHGARVLATLPRQRPTLQWTSGVSCVRLKCL